MRERVFKKCQDLFPGWAAMSIEDFEFSCLNNRAYDLANPFAETRLMLKMPDFKYTMASRPLAVNPIQKIRFIPYAYQRFKKFLDSYGKQGPGDKP